MTGGATKEKSFSFLPISEEVGSVDPLDQMANHCERKGRERVWDRLNYHNNGRTKMVAQSPAALEYEYYNFGLSQSEALDRYQRGHGHPPGVHEQRIVRLCTCCVDGQHVSRRV